MNNKLLIITAHHPKTIFLKVLQQLEDCVKQNNVKKVLAKFSNFAVIIYVLGYVNDP